MDRVDSRRRNEVELARTVSARAATQRVQQESLPRRSGDEPCRSQLEAPTIRVEKKSQMAIPKCLCDRMKMQGQVVGVEVRGRCFSLVACSCDVTLTPIGKDTVAVQVNENR